MTNMHFSSTSTFIPSLRWNLCVLLLLAMMNGCGSNNQRLTQLQNENDRLLNEYRAQRDQVAQLNEKLAVAQNRLAESEKLLARQSPMPSSRVSRLNDPSSLPSGPTFGAQGRGAGASAVAAGTSGQGVSNQANGSPNSGSNASSPSDLYWRPMRRETP